MEILELLDPDIKELLEINTGRNKHKIMYRFEVNFETHFHNTMSKLLIYIDTETHVHPFHISGIPWRLKVLRDYCLEKKVKANRSLSNNFNVSTHQ